MSDRDQLKMLAKKGERFRRCPIVDDDFPGIRDDFDRELAAAHRHLDKPRPVVVCLCGSTRFKDEFVRAYQEGTDAGRIMLSVGRFMHADHDVSPDLKVHLDELHLRKIDLADEVLILNCGRYLGASTINELEYALRLGKPVNFLEPVPDVRAEIEAAKRKLSDVRGVP